MPATTIKIAIADDHSLVRHGIIALINNFAGCQVIAEADNGQALIEQIRVLEHKPDVCLLDISMPVMDGYATVAILRKHYPGMRFLALTVFDQEYSVVKMIRNGANGYLLKGSEINELQDAIMHLYNYGYYYSNIADEKMFRLAADSTPVKLSEKEQQFIRLSCTDLQYSKIAEIMHVSVRTIEDYKHLLRQKLHVYGRIGLVMFALQTGMVALNDTNLQQQSD